MTAHSPVTVPLSGKLMLAGEYSVLEPGGQAVALAVPTSLRVAVAASETDTAASEALGVGPCPPTAEPRLRFVAAALDAVRQALGATPPVAVTVRGSLHRGRRKLGLGSSAAVCVGVVAAAWRHWTGQWPARDVLVRLAWLAHARAQGVTGSGYDVATIAAAGPDVVHWTPGAAQHLEAAPARGALDAWLAAPWPGQHLATLPRPTGVQGWAVWTGRPADTGHRLRTLAQQPAARRRRALAPMQQAAGAMAAALRAGDGRALLEALAAAEEALLGADAQLTLGARAPHATRVRDLVRRCGAVARTSGAAGGDFLLAWSSDPEAGARLAAACAQAGLLLLPLRPAPPAPWGR